MQTVMRDPLSAIFETELKMYTHKKVRVNGEIEGLWGKPKRHHQCRCCGSRLVSVPRVGHVNSPFWVNERPDGMILKACPKNCLESDAVEKMEQYLCDVDMKTGDSWEWDWDYTKLENGWLKPDGGLIICDKFGHCECLPYGLLSWSDAEKAGYMKFTNSIIKRKNGKSFEIEFSWRKKPTKYQKRFLARMSIANNNSLSDYDHEKMSDKNGALYI